MTDNCSLDMEKPLGVLPCFDPKDFAFFSLLTQLKSIAIYGLGKG